MNDKNTLYCEFCDAHAESKRHLENETTRLLALKLDENNALKARIGSLRDALFATLLYLNDELIERVAAGMTTSEDAEKLTYVVDEIRKELRR